jgi:hypothetical protein
MRVIFYDGGKELFRGTLQNTSDDVATIIKDDGWFVRCSIGGVKLETPSNTQKFIEHEKVIKHTKNGIKAIKDYIDFHFRRPNEADIQYLVAIEDKCKELLKVLEEE